MPDDCKRKLCEELEHSGKYRKLSEEPYHSNEYPQNQAAWSSHSNTICLPIRSISTGTGRVTNISAPSPPIGVAIFDSSCQSVQDSLAGSCQQIQDPLAGGKTLSLAESLPTELFRKILLQLPISSVLAVKFTCRSFYMKTKYHDGSEIVDLKRAVVHNMPARKFLHFRPGVCPQVSKEINAIAAILIDFEVRDVKTLDKLTCSVCARCKPNGPGGFLDSYFKQRQLTRYCNACLWHALPSRYLPQPLVVQGSVMRYCGACRTVVRNLRLCPNCEHDDGDMGRGCRWVI